MKWVVQVADPALDADIVAQAVERIEGVDHSAALITRHSTSEICATTASALERVAGLPDVAAAAAWMATTCTAGPHKMAAVGSEEYPIRCLVRSLLEQIADAGAQSNDGVGGYGL